MRKNQILKLEFTPCVRKSGRRLADGHGTPKAGRAPRTSWSVINVSCEVRQTMYEELDCKVTDTT